jgi:hypothetical protein
VVGKAMNKTVILVRNEIYRVQTVLECTTSILRKILPAIEEKNYLAEHNMEWKDSNKTKTGPENSGLVKFLFQCHLFA